MSRFRRCLVLLAASVLAILPAVRAVPAIPNIGEWVCPRPPFTFWLLRGPLRDFPDPLRRAYAHTGFRDGNFLRMVFALGHVEMNLSIDDVGSRHWRTAL